LNCKQPTFPFTDSHRIYRTVLTRGTDNPRPGHTENSRLSLPGLIVVVIISAIVLTAALFWCRGSRAKARREKANNRALFEAENGNIGSHAAPTMPSAQMEMEDIEPLSPSHLPVTREVYENSVAEDHVPPPPRYEEVVAKPPEQPRGII
jgi:hypothetical protein